MKRVHLFFSCVLFIFISTGCGQENPPNLVYIEADSILLLTMALQSRIGSAEVQRMHDFQVEIIEDMNVLSRVSGEDTSLIRYRELSEGLGQCMQACNQYHEEAFMLESSLRDIMEQSLAKETKHHGLKKLLLYEMDNYNDLQRRVDSSLNFAIRQAEIFYSLKPEIDRIKEKEVAVAEQLK